MSCEKDVMKHRHHIIPRYMGGSNKKENLVEVTITQHAMLHYCNYQLWGNDEDKLAWMGLSGIIDKQQVVYEAILLAQRKATVKAKSPEVRKKRLESLHRIGHQQGETNSQYGKKWIHNVDLRQSTRIDKDAPIPDGWKPGRVQNFNSYLKKLKIKEQKINNNKKQLQDKIKHFTELYQVYLTKGFQYIKKEYNYDKTQENLILSFRKYANGYEPYKKLAHKTPPPSQPSTTP